MKITEEALTKIHQQIIFLEKVIYIEENNFNILNQATIVPKGSSESVLGLIYRIITSQESLKNIKAYHSLKMVPSLKQDKIYTCKDNKYTLQILRRIRYVIDTIPIPQLERDQINQQLEQFAEYSIEGHECNAQIQLDYYIKLEKRLFFELYSSIFYDNENKILGNKLTILENICKIITNSDSLQDCDEYLELKKFIATLEIQKDKNGILESSEEKSNQLIKLFGGLMEPIVDIG